MIPSTHPGKTRFRIAASITASRDESIAGSITPRATIFPMQAYHHFPTNRSLRHLAVGFGFLLLPLLGLLAFSKVTGIPFLTVTYDLLLSTWRLAVAFVIATVIGWSLVVLLIRGKTEHPTLAILDVLQSLPTFAILP